MAFDGSTWDETVPDDTKLAINIDDYNRDLRKGVRGRMAHEHEWPASQSATSEAGKHKFVTLQMQTGAISLSGTQVGGVYQKTIGTTGDSLMFINAATQEINISDRTYYWFLSDEVAVATNVGARLIPISDGKIKEIQAYLGTTATGGVGVRVDVNYDGTSIWTATANQPLITAGSTGAAIVSTFVQTAVTSGGYFTLDVDTVGTSTAGSDLTVLVKVG